jgi:hypothetical protein
VAPAEPQLAGYIAAQAAKKEKKNYMYNISGITGS